MSTENPYPNQPNQPDQPNQSYPPQQPGQPYSYPPQPGQPYPPQQPGQSYPYPPQPPVPAPKKKRTGCIVGAMVAVVVILACIISATAMSSNKSQTSTAATTSTTGSTPAATATTAPTKAATSLKWTTVQTFKGNGSKKTDTFTVNAPWKLKWTCDHSSFQGMDYNVSATVENADGGFADMGVNAMCKSGSTSGETTVTSGGTVLLDIISEGDWTFTIQEQK